ncbi:MAG TPA: propanediol/glycerol family dehydratase large subunit, partial [Propionicimonas sp.]
TFIASYGINLERAVEANAIDSVRLAHMLCDINIPRDELIPLTTALTPAKAAEVVSRMSVLEMMAAVTKLRARKRPAMQGHVTSVTDNPVQLAADAAEAGIRGFAEEETTVGIVRYAPLNALAVLVGSQTGRPGILSQCAVEEATELQLGMRGLTSYAETVSVYGTEAVFMDGDDTPWSKAFLASCYASRGLKMRFTSGTGSEVQMGFAEGMSMLYLESRCQFITRAAGSQGTQNGSVSCVGVVGGVPQGVRAFLAENLIAMMLDLECASANDQSMSQSDLRRVARSLMQFVPGTDFICSGYSTVPNYDNMFGGGHWDAEDFDDWLILQRDMRVDGALSPVSEEDVIAIRRKATRAIQAVFKELGLPEITDVEVEAATYGHGSRDLPARNVVEDLVAADDLMKREITGLDVVQALIRSGFEDVAEAVFNLIKHRMAGDYLQTAAIFDGEFRIDSAVNNPNDYAGPMTGYQMSPERWDQIKTIRQAVSPESI